jgi:cytidine deaminase
MRKIKKLAELRALDRKLVLAARDASAHAYAPYSGFAVGAAVRSKSGQIYPGANLENAAYGLGICAEVSAITGANAAGDFAIEAIAVVGHKFTEPPSASQIVTPCGRCRQLIFEAGQIAKTDVRIFSCNGDLSLIQESTISELLPDAFGPGNLGLDDAWPKLRSQLAAAVRQLDTRTATPTVDAGQLPQSRRSSGRDR